jgi:hypothetical protein
MIATLTDVGNDEASSVFDNGFSDGLPGAVVAG